jgi:ESS family glutamate:Na+ symporter
MMFMNGMYAAYIVKWFMKKFKIDFLQENVLQNKITALCSDYLVVCAFMAVSVDIIYKYLPAIVLISVIITLVTFVVCVYFGSRIGGENDFERTLGIYGTCTGTVPSGISLVRIVDPEFKTTTGVELGACNVVMIASTPVYIIILAVVSGSIAIEYGLLGLTVCVLIYLIALKLTKSWGKKTFNWK